MFEFNSEEDQHERIRKEDIQRFLSSPATNKSLLDLLANISARLEILEIDNYQGLTAQERKERSEINKKFIAASVEKFTESFIARAPRTTIL